MYSALRLAFWSLALALPLSGEDSLRFVRQAQFRLGSASWSQIVQIENTTAPSIYPRHFHALVFELDGILWLYTPVDGTQSLSRYRGRLSEDKQDLFGLLKFIEPGFSRCTLVLAAAMAANDFEPLPNGCFLESIALLRRLVATGTLIERANLLSYYVIVNGRPHGHTVLQLRTSAGWQIIDASCPRNITSIKLDQRSDALAVARKIRGDVANARTIPLADFAITRLADNESPKQTPANLQTHGS